MEARRGRVEVAVVEVAVKYEPIKLLPRTSPATESFWPGDVVPMPTPVAFTVRVGSELKPTMKLLL